ncbi:MAG: hypothetical protein LIP01_11640 [Tannerellaceae bacterium]|nr:hypothetical protein [Tannerellaceae bacterium]
MKKDEASKQLFNRFLTAWQEGKEPYFDADEIDRLLDSLEEADDWTYYDEIVRLGMRLHPAHLELKLRQCKLYIIRHKFAQALDLLDSLAEPPGQDLDMLRLECYCNLHKYEKVLSWLQHLEDI